MNISPAMGTKGTLQTYRYRRYLPINIAFYTTYRYRRYLLRKALYSATQGTFGTYHRWCLVNRYQRYLIYRYRRYLITMKYQWVPVGTQRIGTEGTYNTRYFIYRYLRYLRLL